MDLVIVTKGLLPDISDSVLETMAKNGYDYCGPMPIFMDKS